MTPYFNQDGITLYHGDCREVMATLGRFDLLLTDPPYVVDTKGGGIGAKRQYLKDIAEADIDRGFDSAFLDQFPNWFCFCGKPQIPQILSHAVQSNWMLLTWCKHNPTPLVNSNYLPDTEWIFHKWSKGRLFGDYANKSRFYVSSVGKSEFDHPTVEPIGLIRKLVLLGSKEGETILDPFAGSGTTLLAAKLEGRQAVGIEISERYCEIAANRLRQRVLF
jgi:site-specific DNA-methyltransferase (adenine-specific)